MLFEKPKAPTPYESQDKKIKSNELYANIANITSKKPLEDFIPTEIEEKIQTTIDANPYNLRAQDILTTASTGSNTPVVLLRTSSVLDTYLTGFVITAQDTNVGGAFYASMSFTSVGNDNHQEIFYLHGNSTNINQNTSCSLNFPGKGVLLTRDTNVILGGNADQSSLMIVGYTIDTSTYTMNGE